MKKPIPIGVSDFKEMITGGFVYVDKTLFIQELVDLGTNRVTLIPRMRRFGKTLNLSMLQYFFENSAEDTSYLFSSLNIWKLEKYRSLQGQYPVIFITLKGIKASSWQQAFNHLCLLISKEFGRHLYLLEGQTLNYVEKEQFQAIFTNKEANIVLVSMSLQLLSEWLYRYHNKKVILLIDEYDTPAHTAYEHGYYEEMSPFWSEWLSGIKDNRFLEFAVFTGILRIAKESIFSGVNNVNTFTILNEEFQDKFGLLEPEVKLLLEEYGLQNILPEMKMWYDGYRIGTTNAIYNPWSVLNCIERKGRFDTYWLNTSNNALVNKLVSQGDGSFKKDLEELLREGSIAKDIDEGLVFIHLEKNPNAIWSLLLYSGYVTCSEPYVPRNPCHLKIPNKEVEELYQSMILNWFKQSINLENYHLLLDSLTKGAIDAFSWRFQQFFGAAFSFFDVTHNEPEKVYHAFILGMLIGLQGKFEVRSNRESGDGRYDVTLFPKNPNDLGIIMEFKKVNPFEKIDLAAAADVAVKQIEEKKYATELIDRGIKRLLFLGLAFEGKNVLIHHKFKTA
jgi:hypothetical protein